MITVMIIIIAIIIEVIILIKTIHMVSEKS